jgi:hypothetical protein
VALNFLKNPFERLSAENQEDMKKNIKEMKEYFTDESKNTIVLGLANIEKELKSLSTKVEALTAKIKETAGGKIDEKSLQEAGKASIMLGDGIEKIITSIKIYSKIPDTVIDKFVEGLSKIGEGFEKLGKSLSDIEKGGQALMSLAKGVFWFGVALLISGPIYLLALPLSIIVVGVIMGMTWLFSKVMGDAETMKGIQEGGKALAYLALGIILFGLALLVAGPIYKAAMSWSLLLIVGVIVVAAGLMWLLGKVYNEDIVPGIKALMWMGLAIVVFGIALVVATKIYEYLWKEQKDGMLIVGLVILAAVGVLLLLSYAKDNVLDGAEALVYMAIGIIVLAVGLWMFSKLFPATPENWETLGLVGAAVGGLTIVLLGLSLVKDNVTKGAIALLIATGAIMLLAVGLWMFSDMFPANPQNWETLALVGLAITGLTIVLSILGGMSVMVLAGAGALIMAAGAVNLLAYGMKIWVESKVTPEDALTMTAMITALALIGTVLGNPFTSWMTLIGAGIMLVIGVSLVAIADAMKTFKSSNVTKSDAENIGEIVNSLAGTFAKVTTEGGKDWDWWDVRRGIYAMENLGSTLKGIAEGVQAWANLTISEYEYDEKTGEMKEVARVKLTKTDFDNVAHGMAQVIGSLAGPLSEVGMADAGKGGGFWSGIFGGKGYVRKGIAALQGIGGVLSGLAGGIQDFANLTFSEYELVDTGEGVMELREVSRTKITDSMLKATTKNIARVLTEVVKPFGKIGQGSWTKLFAGNDFPYTSKDIKKGVESLTGIGDVISGIAKGIIDFSNFNFVTQKVITNPETGMPELVPDEVIHINDTILKKTSENIGKIIIQVAEPFGKIGQGSWGKLFSGNDFPYKSKDIKKGVESLTGIGSVLTGLAEGVRGFARMEFIEHDVKEIDGIPTIVPTGVFKMNHNDIKEAGLNMGLILSVTARAIGDFYTKYSKDEDKIKKAIAFIGLINKESGKVGESMVKLSEGISKIKNFDKFSGNMTSFLEAFINPFNPMGQNKIGETIDNFTVFSKDVSELAKSADKMEKINKSFSGIAKSMGTFKKELNGLKLEPLTQTKGLFEAMAVISESGSADQILAKYGKTLDQTFKNLAELLEQFGSKVTQSTEQTTTAISNQVQSNESLNETLKKQKQAAEQAPPAQNAQNSQMTSQLKEIATILRGTLKVKDANTGF